MELQRHNQGMAEEKRCFNQSTSGFEEDGSACEKCPRKVPKAQLRAAPKPLRTQWKSKMVGERGFEPPAPASRRQCSTRLSYSPTEAGPAARKRTGTGSRGSIGTGSEQFKRRSPAAAIYFVGRCGSGAAASGCGDLEADRKPDEEQGRSDRDGERGRRGAAAAAKAGERLLPLKPGRAGDEPFAMTAIDFVAIGASDEGEADADQQGRLGERRQ